MTDFSLRLAALRAACAAQGCDGFLVPMADEFQSEYVPASARRVEFMSGFTGSSGFVAVLKDKAAFFTDGRYTLQAAQQVSASLFEIFDSAQKSPQAWLAENCAAGSRLGFDPWLHTDDSVQRLKKALAAQNVTLVPVEKNLVDAVWAERPAPPAEPVVPYDLALAGQPSADKRARLAETLTKNKLDAAVITDTASVAWLLNVRGNDVPNTPLPLSFLIVHADGKADWFLDARKMTPALPLHLGPDVRPKAVGDFAAALDHLGAYEKAVRLDTSESAHWIAERLRAAGARIDSGEDPTALPRACKNAVELEGIRNAHRRDGVALVEFFAWLAAQPFDGLTELGVEKKLAECRAAHNLYRGPSFDTIAGVGPNGAIVHYRATPATDRPLRPGTLLLLDSGGQYLDGTTDVTRTVALGEPSSEMRDRYTRVLKGHIALASIVFPEGTTGAELDVLARQFLWADGIDFNHGTGHGVGAYLGVHEGPQAISKRNRVPLKPGMILSNEPGYYKAGSYGIRFENLQAVVERPDLSGERKMLGFETLTLAPVDPALIDPRLLTDAERSWIDAYHQRITHSVGPHLSAPAAEWLNKIKILKF